MNGLILTAGGARGAYQAGVLKRVAEIPRLQGKPCPFKIITGASAGAINGAAFAAGAKDFVQASHSIAELWGSIQFNNVFKADFISLGARSAHWLQELSLGGVFGGGKLQSLLDFTPLKKYLETHIDFSKVSQAISDEDLYAIGISATSYYSGKSYTFIQGRAGHPLWEKSRRASLSLELKAEHIWASCAIPVIFQPVMLSLPLGDFYFGDGGLRLVNPLSPAIRLGANRVFAIGIRSQAAAEQRSQAELLEAHSTDKPIMRKPPLAQIFGIALNSIFLDHLDSDFEHLNRMNQILKSLGATSLAPSKEHESMRIIRPLALYPSVDLASIAESHVDKLPPLVRYLMEGLGNSKSQSADLVSYLLFDPAYTQELLHIGYQDAHAKIAEIEDFLFTEG